MLSTCVAFGIIEKHTKQQRLDITTMKNKCIELGIHEKKNVNLCSFYISTSSLYYPIITTYLRTRHLIPQK